MAARPQLEMTVTGYAAADPEMRFTQSGKPVANVSVPYTPRRYDQQTGQWVDAGDTVWVRASVWGDQAETFCEHVQKGQLLTLTGRPGVRAWAGNDGQPAAALNLNVDTWGLHPKPTQHGQPAQPAAFGSGNVPAAAQDPWGTGGAPTSEPPLLNPTAGPDCWAGASHHPHLPKSRSPLGEPMKPTFGQRLGQAVGLILALTAAFAVISVILWIIATTWRAIIGG